MRLKFVLKYANTYDSTWDNVDVIKWSLIEILSACICGNLMPLRPIVDKILPSLRSVFSSYSKGSRKNSENSSNGVAKSKWYRVNKGDRKPKLISTLQITRMSLTPRWVSEEESATRMTSPLDKPLPALPEMAHKVHEHHVGEGYMHLVSNRATRGSLVCTMRSFDEESEAGRGGREVLSPPARGREECHSGSWSRALSMIFERR